MDTAENLMRDSIAALRGVGFGHRYVVSHWLRQYEPTPKLRFHSSSINAICLRRCADQRLGWRFIASLVEWPCKAPCALHPSLFANF